jgi:hypothetical protein
MAKAKKTVAQILNLPTFSGQVYEALAGAAEGATERRPDGTVWKPVYLDNTKTEFAVHAWAGALSILKSKGAYLPYDDGNKGPKGTFGLVRIR